MKMILMIFWSALLVCTSERGKGAGIHFSDSLTWAQALAKANAEHKYIFVDCYATWCGPCREMAKSIFPLPEVGDFFNCHFINIRVQIDQTDKDDERVRSWYTDAKTLDSKYGISAFPTYLIFAPDGHIVHRFMGMSRNAHEFIEHAADGLDPEKQYYTIVGRYRDHLGDSAFLRKSLKMAIDLMDTTSERLISDVYIETLHTPYAKANIQMIGQTIYHSGGRAFTLFSKDPKQIDSVMGKEFAEGRLIAVLFDERIRPLLVEKEHVNWESLSESLQEMCPVVADRVVKMSKVTYYMDGTANRTAFENAVREYVETYGDRFSDFELNNMAWLVFQRSLNKKVLDEALAWSYRTVANYPIVTDWANVDTYANLQYKLGNREKAIEWEKKAIEIARDPSQRAEFEKVLHKMEMGQPTWR